MKILVTGSAGHLGEALIRSLRASANDTVGLDICASPFTDCVGSISNRGFVRETLSGCDLIIHSATLHKPHVGTHSRQDFIDTNVTGTLNLLEEAVEQNCSAFVYTSTTSTFGDAMKPAEGEPAVWVTENLPAKPKNIYGVTKMAAEDLCQLFHRNTGLACIVLKTSRFFPEEDDAKNQRALFADSNLKVNELLFRRVDISDLVNAHILALAKANEIKFAKYIISATTPFQQSDAPILGTDAPSVVKNYVPQYLKEYQRRNWKIFQSIGRVYDNASARKELGWEPEYTFARAIELLSNDADFRSELARTVGSKGYHPDVFSDGPYPVTGF